MASSADGFFTLSCNLEKEWLLILDFVTEIAPEFQIQSALRRSGLVRAGQDNILFRMAIMNEQPNSSRCSFDPLEVVVSLGGNPACSRRERGLLFSALEMLVHSRVAIPTASNQLAT